MALSGGSRQIDRTVRCAPYAIGGLLVASLATALLPHLDGQGPVLLLSAVSGIAFVAISAAPAAFTTPATRGLVMGGYSTCLYLGLALGSLALGPVITLRGHVTGFLVGGGAGMFGTLLAAILWANANRAGARLGAARTNRPGSVPRCPLETRARALGEPSSAA